MVVFTPVVTSKIVKFEGYVPRVLDEDKLNQVVTHSTANVRNETFTGTIKKYNINVTEMTESNYKDLMFFLRNAITFQVKDTDTGFEDSAKYTFDGNGLALTCTEDKDQSEMIYSGGLAIICTIGS